MIKEIIEDLKEIKHLITQYIKVKKHALRFELARNIADMLQIGMNRQISIVIAGKKRKFEWWTSDTLKERKKQGLVPKSWGMYELGKVTFYKTAESRNNKVPKEDRIKYKEKFLEYAKKFMR
jgi:hypothetical protein